MDKIDFKAFGFDEYADDFLNWCMKNRNNLEKIKFKKAFPLKSGSATYYFSDTEIIGRIDKNYIDSF